MATLAKPFMPLLFAPFQGFNSPSLAPAGLERVLADFPGVTVCPFMEAATHPSVDLVVIAEPQRQSLPSRRSRRSGQESTLLSTSPSPLTSPRPRELVRIARQQNRLLSVFQNRRWEGDILAAKAILESGRLGKVTHFEAHHGSLPSARPSALARRSRSWSRSLVRSRPASHRSSLFTCSACRTAVLAKLCHACVPADKTDDWAHVQLILSRYARHPQRHFAFVRRNPPHSDSRNDRRAG